MKRNLFFLNLLLISILLAGCATSNNLVNTDPIDFDANYLNQQIGLVAIKELSSFDTRNPITILLNYNTTNRIIFSENYDLRLFVFQYNEWTEISEIPMDRYPKGDIVLSPDDPSSYSQMVTFIPNIPDKEKKYHLRIYVFGELQTAGGETKTVSAFTDVLLTPLK